MKTTCFPLTFFPAIRETETVIRGEKIVICDFTPDIAETYFCADNIKVKVLKEFNGRVLLESHCLLPFKTTDGQTREMKGYIWAGPKDISD